MKVFICILWLGLVPSLFAQKTVITQEEALPEPSEPPFKVGELPLESGYLIKREDEPDLNFRIVDNKMRLYWIDDDGLIMEPDVSAVTIRFDENTLRNRTRDYHRLKRLSDDVALGSPYILIPPHLYYVTLVINPPGSDEVKSYRFRYQPTMDKVSSKPFDS